MPTPSSILIPDFNGAQQKSGVLQDSNNINYPLVRFDDNVINVAQTGISGTYANGQIVGSYFSFASVAANVGWGGAIAGAALQINNTVLAADTLSLLLFSITPAASGINATSLSALTLSDTEANSYIGSITFANALTVSGRNLFSVNTLNLKYVCEATLNALTGILVLNTSASSRTLSSASINIKLQITRS
jgi:hypothetical protein